VREENARLLQALNLERRQADEKLKLLAEAKEALAEQFQNLANRIFEEKGEKLVQQNVANLDSLLKPLGERAARVPGAGRGNLRQGVQAALLAAERNSQARRGEREDEHGRLEPDQCAQGGIRRPRERGARWSSSGSWRLPVWRKAGSTNSRRASRLTDGGRARPDVIIRLPENKHLVIDSKVSLTAYEAYCSAGDDLARKRELARHIESLRGHVKGLAEKNYQSLYAIRTPDFVLMFMPVEAAFSLAVREKPDLFETRSSAA
jgi:DNA recombination protein RmuC